MVDCRSGMSGSQRYAQDGVGTEVLFVGSAIQRQHRAVNSGLIGRVFSEKCFGDFVVDVGHGGRDAFAHVHRFVTVTQLPRFVSTRAGTAGNCRATERSIAQINIALDSWVAAAVKNLSCSDAFNQRHCGLTIKVEGWYWLDRNEFATLRAKNGRVQRCAFDLHSVQCRPR